MGGVLAALAILAVLGVVGALALPNLIGGNTGAAQSDSPNEQANVGGSDNGGGGQNGGSQGEDQDSRNEQANAAGPSEENAGNGDRGSQDGSNGANTERDEPAAPVGGLTAEAAEQTIREHYEVAASDEYQNAWNYLSTSYQQEWGAPAAWTDQFSTLESVRFTSGPTAQVEGDTATVTFSTVARHTDRVDRPDVTATLVPESDEWKIDNLSVG